MSDPWGTLRALSLMRAYNERVDRHASGLAELKAIARSFLKQDRLPRDEEVWILLRDVIETSRQFQGIASVTEGFHPSKYYDKLETEARYSIEMHERFPLAREPSGAIFDEAYRGVLNLGSPGTE